MQLRLLDAQQSIDLASQLLHSLSPRQVVRRGYGICKAPDGTLVTAAKGRKAGDGLEIWLADGKLGCIVETISLDEPEP